MLSYHFVCFFCVQLFANFLRIALFNRKGAKIGFFKFLCFKLKFGNFSFLGLLKHYKKRGFRPIFVFCVVEREEGGKKMITGISGLGFFWSKNGRFVNVFQKKILAETPIFIVFWVRVFWSKLSKKWNFGHPPKKLTDNWKNFFLVFLCFFFSPFCSS